MLVALQAVGITVGTLVGLWLIRSFFPSYFSEKGKNLATKEDIQEITKKPARTRFRTVLRRMDQSSFLATVEIGGALV